MLNDMVKVMCMSNFKGVNEVICFLNGDQRMVSIKFDSMENLRDATGQLKSLRDDYIIEESNVLMIDQDKLESAMFMSMAIMMANDIGIKHGFTKYQTDDLESEK